MKADSGCLSGWQNIANYLNKGVRTLQRYEHELGLPVHRSAGATCSPVLADLAELDVWVKTSPFRSEFSRSTTHPAPGFQGVMIIRESIKQMKQAREQVAISRNEIKTLRIQVRDNLCK